MKQDKKQAFLQSIKQDIAAIKLVKYRYLIQNYPGVAEKLRDQMLELSLDNKLIGEYKLICQMFKISQVPNPVYQKLREALVNQTNPLHAAQKNYKAQQNYQKQAQTLEKLGRIYFSYGQYRQSALFFGGISSINTNYHGVKFEDYATQFGLAFYYLNEYYSLCRFNSRFIDKDVLKKLSDLCILRDINNFDYRRNMDNPFKNIIQMELNNVQLAKNRVMSYDDLGYCFSLLSIAYKKKSQIKFLKWSYKLENKFVNNKYKDILETLEIQKQKRCFLPAINKIYEVCQSNFKKRIIVQIVSAFDRCPFRIIQQMTGINQGQVRIFVKNNPQIPLLFDPITSSVTLKRTITPLYKQVRRLCNYLQNKYNEQLVGFQKRDEQDGSQMHGIGRRPSGGRMGGMGGMGGRMGMMQMFGHRF